MAMLALAVAATAGILRLSFWLEAPAPAAPVNGWRDLAVPGYRLLAAGTEPPMLGRDLSHGGKASFRVATADGQDLGLTMHLLPSRLRGTDDVSLAAITKHVSELQVKDAKEQPLEAVRAATGTVAIGGIDEKPALQTCINYAGRPGVGTSELLERASTPRHGEVLLVRLRQLAGLQVPLRAECVLLTVVGQSPEATEEQMQTFAQALVESWRHVRPWPAQVRPAPASVGR